MLEVPKICTKNIPRSLGNGIGWICRAFVMVYLFVDGKGDWVDENFARKIQVFGFTMKNDYFMDFNPIRKDRMLLISLLYDENQWLRKHIEFPTYEKIHLYSFSWGIVCVQFSCSSRDVANFMTNTRSYYSFKLTREFIPSTGIFSLTLCDTF